MVFKVVFSPKFLEHDPSPYNPEIPERLRSTLSYLKEREDIEIVRPGDLEDSDILRVHSDSYVKKLKSVRGVEFLSPDTPVFANTYEIAKLACGAVYTAIKIAEEKPLVLSRPPGHHAGRNYGSGFCYLNDVGVAVTKYLQDKNAKFAIVDYDAHYGQGTAEIFYEDPNVLYISLHQDPATLYPGVGFANEIGEGEGKGFNIPIPLPPYASDSSYEKAINEIVLPILSEFKPDYLILYVGADAHARDPLANLMLSVSCYAKIANILSKFCKKVFAIMAGGYNLDVLPKVMHATLLSMNNEKAPYEETFSEDVKVIEKTEEVLMDCKEILKEFWSL